MHSKEAFLSSLRAQMLYRSDEVARFNEDSRVAERVDWEKPFLFEEYMRAFTRFILHQQVDWTISKPKTSTKSKSKSKSKPKASTKSKSKSKSKPKASTKPKSKLKSKPKASTKPKSVPGTNKPKSK